MMMSGFDRDQLDALRGRVEEEYRRAEEEYRLDMAAIERLQRRFFGSLSGMSTSSMSASTYSSPSEPLNIEPPVTMQAPPPAPAAPRSDEWAMFKAAAGRK